MIDKNKLIVNIFIGSEATRLYDLEQKRNELITRCAKEWSRIVKVDEKDFWSIAVPTAIYDILGGWDSQASIRASIEFLKSKSREGGIITKEELLKEFE